ncbi:MAG: hypothetical protein Q7V58_12240 [Actinomycetota bacterium]|nr:hypothetical protein [Actinomycetota bacterium]
MLVLGIDRSAGGWPALAAGGVGAGRLIAALDAEPAVLGAVVLSTCARTEAYVDTARFHDAHRAFVRALAAASGEPEQDIARWTRARRGPQALEHLFRVAAGLESAVVGEHQVTGQVRAALAEAVARGTTTRSLDLAFQNALRVSRMARTRLLPRHRTIAAAAWQQAADGVPGLVPGVALVIGTGAFARECAAEARQRGSHTVLVHSPSGRNTADIHGDHEVAADELVDALAVSDVTLAASGHGTAVITPAIAEQALRQRSTPLVILDLAAARDTAPGVADEPGIHVVTIDEVAGHAGGVTAAAALVHAEAQAIYPRIAGPELDDVIVTLRRRVESLVGGSGVDEADPVLADAVRKVTQALLHEPTARAREAAASGRLDQYRAALETVFGTGTGTGLAPESATRRARGSAA